MASRGWGGSVVVALGVAAATAAAGLGLGYGLGIITWPTATDAAGESAWLASLAWTTWIGATSTIFGAVVADRLSAGDYGAAPPRRSTVERDGVYRSSAPGAVATTAWRLVIALTAAVGGLLTVPLVAVPARAAHRPDTYAPQLIAGGYAVIGVVLGLLIAILALATRAVAANVILNAAWLWLLATASVVHGVASGSGLSTAQLAVWRFTGHFVNGSISLPGAALMLGAALVLGALGAWPALRQGDSAVGVTISGAAGPALVAVAYLLAAPKLPTAPTDHHLSAYLTAPYAVIAGLAGSVVLSAVLAHRQQRAANRAAAVPAQPTRESALDARDDEDAYAPARAYAPESDPDLATVEARPAATPLWPPQDSGAGTEAKPSGGTSAR
jgi:hypothetical protein